MGVWEVDIEGWGGMEERDWGIGLWEKIELNGGGKEEGIEGGHGMDN